MSDLPLRLQRRSPDLTPPRSVRPALAEALAELAAADSVATIADAVVRHAASLTSARASALCIRTPLRSEIEIVGSVGYDCASMGVGALLPLDAGLPVTEAVRTRQPVVRLTPDGGWVAVPLAEPDPVGSLLVSLSSSGTPDVALLSALAGHARAALHRVGGLRRAAASPPDAQVRPAGLDVATRCQSLRPEGGGDLVDVVQTSPEVLWLVTADACGFGDRAHALAQRTSRLVRALVSEADDPAELLETLDEALSRTDEDMYITALAVRLDRCPDGTVEVQLASAGHPLPVGVAAAGALVADPDANGAPLNLRLDDAPRPSTTRWVLRPGDALVAYTDGLVDRIGQSVADDILADVCARAVRLDDTEAALDVLLDVLTASQGAPRDDVAAVLVRVPR